MPEHKQTIAAENLDMHSIKALAYGTFIHLNWTAKYAADHLLVGYTPRSWKRYDNEITIEAAENELSVTSKMVHGEAFDMMKRTQKDVNDFVNAFETVKQKASPAEIEEWKLKITGLQTDTVKAAEEEIKQAEEIDKVMHFSKGDMQVTYGIMIVNAVVFVLMVLDGAGLFDPNGIVHAKWGSNYSPLTLSGDSWRLITNIFIHFGIIHIAFNMYALYMVGVYLEPMLGKLRYFTAYITTGVLASISSLWWHTDGVNSAGASGAIFGLYGLFLALMIMKQTPDAVRKSLLPSIAVFVGYNLIYGLKGGIDNAAHIGGLISGFAVGIVYAAALKQEKQTDGKKTIWPVAVIIGLTVAATMFFLNNNQATPTERKTAQAQINSSKYKDSEKFNDRLNDFDRFHNAAIEFMGNTSLPNEEVAEKIKKEGLPNLQKAADVLYRTTEYDVPEEMHQKATKLDEYITIRKEEMNLILKILQTTENAEMFKELEKLREKATAVFDEAIQLQ